MDGRKSYSWIKYRAIARACVSQTSRKAGTRLRENVITDLINWTYRRRGTKWLALYRPPGSHAELPRSGHCLAMITMKVYQLWARARIVVGVHAYIHARPAPAASNSIVSSKPAEKRSVANYIIIISIDRAAIMIKSQWQRSREFPIQM